MNAKRGTYGELKSVPERDMKMIRNLVNGAAQADKVDEHGAWEFGCEFDNKGRGSALNWDVYGYGRDRHDRRFLAVIQVRQFVRQRKNWFPQIRKSYFLLGRNEDKSIFAHAVQSAVVHRAIRDNADVVRRVQKWIFGCDYERVIRHGDIALVPLSRQPAAPVVDTDTLAIGPSDNSASHELSADEIRQNGNLYAKNPHLTHAPGTHPDVAGAGWYRVMIGRRAATYDFAAPTID